jgi:hypothetical protein
LTHTGKPARDVHFVDRHRRLIDFVRAPTTNPGLQTIADKIARYRHHFSGIVCVLFDVQDETHYEEWLKGIRDATVVVIRIP